MGNKKFLHAAGVTCPLRVVLGLTVDNETVLEIPSFLREFLIAVFLKFLDPVAYACLSKNILSRVDDSRMKNSENDFCHQTPCISRFDSSALIIEVDVSDLTDELFASLGLGFEDFQKLIFANTGLMWLRLDDIQLNEEQLKSRLNKIIALKEQQIAKTQVPWFIDVVKNKDDNRARGNKEYQINTWLRYDLLLRPSEYSLKSRKTDDGILYHLWVKSEALDHLGLRELGLKSQSGYQPLDDIYKLVQLAVSERTKEIIIPDRIPGDC